MQVSLFEPWKNMLSVRQQVQTDNNSDFVECFQESCTRNRTRCGWWWYHARIVQSKAMIQIFKINVSLSGLMIVVQYSITIGPKGPWWICHWLALLKMHLWALFTLVKERDTMRMDRCTTYYSVHFCYLFQSHTYDVQISTYEYVPC